MYTYISSHITTNILYPHNTLTEIYVHVEYLL